jgi:LytS/YehU family sensor histidine kinase
LLTFSVDGQVKDKKVAPILFLPIVENCFKHGASKQTAEKWVHVKFQANGQGIFFEAENSIPTGEKKARDSQGIGLKNTRARLDLLYPGHYTLEVIKTGKFAVRLRIQH